MSADDYFSGKNKDQELSSLDPKQRTDASGGSVFVAAKTSTDQPLGLHRYRHRGFCLVPESLVALMA